MFQSHLLLLHIISQGKNTFTPKDSSLQFAFFVHQSAKKCENDGNNLPSGIVVTLESNLLGKKEIIKAKTLKERYEVNFSIDYCALNFGTVPKQDVHKANVARLHVNFWLILHLYMDVRL